MRYRSRAIDLSRPGARESADNLATVCITARAPRDAFEPRALFVAHYERIRASCLGFAQPGLAVFAFSLDGRWRGTMCLAACAGEARAAVVGRHAAADLFLDGDPGLALRHLAYVLEPTSLRAAVRGEVRFRVLDLETGSPPTDDEGRRVASLTAEGPVFLRCRDFALLAVLTGDETDWPPRASDAWDCLPERVFVEERLAAGSGVRRLPCRAPQCAPAARRTTLVRIHEGPSDLAAGSLDDDDDPCGVLAVSSRGRRRVLRVGREALRRGLLLGRYERCHAHAAAPIQDERVSRVHLIIIELAGRVFAIDLASTNGSFALGTHRSLGAAALADGQRIGLAGAETTVAWYSARALR